MRGRLCIVQMQAKPIACGVTDHSLKLAEALRLRGVSVQLLTTGAATAEFDHLDLTVPPQIKQINVADDVLIQLSGYGFDPRGIPDKLEKWLRSLRDSPWQGRMIVFFHETWVSTLQPWRSAFWYAPYQRFICGQIASLADIAIFNSVSKLRWGEAKLGISSCIYAPVYSNIGEPQVLPDWKPRNNRCVVFGSSATRSTVYHHMRGRMQQFLDDWNFSEIVDIGHPLEKETTRMLEGFPIRALGPLPAGAVGKELSSVRAGLFHTPWAFASKSGVYAAYQAYGVVPVSIFDAGDSRYIGAPGPVFGTHFSSVARSLASECQEVVSNNVYAEYQKHSVAQFSERFLQLMS